MASTKALLDRLRPLGSIFWARDAIEVGVNWRDLYALRDGGHVFAVSRGLYQLAEFAGTEHLDFVVVCKRATNATICLNSALAYWDLSDEIPSTVHLAVPARTHRPAIDYPPTTVHVFAAATFELGRAAVTVDDRARFWITDRERTVVDAYRLRHLIGDELAHDAMRRYLRARPRPARLSQLAGALRVGTAVTDTIRILAG